MSTIFHLRIHQKMLTSTRLLKIEFPLRFFAFHIQFDVEPRAGEYLYFRNRRNRLSSFDEEPALSKKQENTKLDNLKQFQF